MTKYRWVLRPIDDPEAVTQLQQALNNLPEALARTLVLRGIDSFDAAKRFFRPSLNDLHDPFLMQDMDDAARRVAQAIQQRERVLVYGDYDVDGTTSTALMMRFLSEMGVEAAFFIPNRFTHGYGLNIAGIDYAVEQGARLIIALDCGITALDEARYAREHGIGLIICDHHTAGDTLPDALAVLDPKRPECSYPFKELSGCGVTFKLVEATLRCLEESPEQAFSYADLVAISTASDIVPLTGENRVLMREGFKRLRQQPSLGLRKLAQQARLDFNHLTVDRIVFGIGPRINAAGRMGEAHRAVALLLSDDSVEATKLAALLEHANQQRRTLDQETQAQAIRKAEIQLGGRMRHALVLHEPDWHQGVVGIVASRLVDRFHRPAVMLCTANDAAKGSARSITGINIYTAIKACEDLLTQFGGHDFAAGLTLPEENIPAFRERLDEVVGRMMTPEMMIPAIKVDASLNLHDLDDRFWNVLNQFAPFGPENMKPIFLSRDLEVMGPPKTVGNGGAHLKFSVRQRGGSSSPPRHVIGFGMGAYLQTVLDSRRNGQPLSMVFSIEENTWQGRTSLQLRARDLRVEDS
ncbi:MAG: single-stranded-DNA-specific exonuclease RecJ [Rhodothermales bacterium]